MGPAQGAQCVLTLVPGSPTAPSSAASSAGREAKLASPDALPLSPQLASEPALWFGAREEEAGTVSLLPASVSQAVRVLAGCAVWLPQQPGRGTYGLGCQGTGESHVPKTS